MAEHTSIEWADHTWSPWEGCTKVSPACDLCYAARRNSWLKGGSNWGPGAPRLEFSEDHWDKPIRWNAKAVAAGKRMRVFPSICDPFDNEVRPDLRGDFFELIRQTPHLDWLLLTKRIGNAVSMVRSHGAIAGNGIRYLPDNAWLGATIATQQEFDRDVPKLLRTRAELGALVLFLSIEPMLGPIQATSLYVGSNSRIPGVPAGHDHVDPLRLYGGIDWVICGGESGPGARPMHPEWARSLRDQCEQAGVPFLFKQWGDWAPRGPESMGYPVVDGVPRMRLTDAGHNGSDLAAGGGNHVWMNRAGKKVTGRGLDGRTHDGFPVSWRP